MKHILTNAKAQYWLFLFAFLLPNLLMTFTEGHPWYTAILQLCFGAGLFGSLMALGSKPGRQVFVLFLFIFFDAFQLVLLYLYGSSPISVDMFLNLAATNANEAGELLGNIFLGVSIVVLQYAFILFVAGCSWRHKITLDCTWRKRIRRRVMLPLFVLSTALCLVLQEFTPLRIYTDVYPVNVSYNAGLAIYRYTQLANYDSRVKDFRFDAVPTHDADEQETYVLVIGETARSLNFSLYGYGRDTNPRLAKRLDAQIEAVDCLDSFDNFDNVDHLDKLLVYSDVLSESNTTHKSVPLLLTAAEAADPDVMYYERSLMTAFKEAGFHTIFISNQADNGAFVDHYSHEADQRLYVRQEGKLPDDADMLTALRQTLAGDTHHKRLIVMHSYGSHFKYCERVPEEYRRFKPCDDKQLHPKNREYLINAFDNTILYTDMVLDSIISIVQEMPCDAQRPHSAMLLYTSDHGEDIYDDEHENFLHASPVVTRYQLAVPFMVWLSADYAEAHPTRASILAGNTERHVAPGRVVFHTMLDAAGIRCTRLRPDHSLCNPAYTTPPHLFLNDRNEGDFYE